ncbi:MAG TPA: hypothetical protein VGI17_11585 [Solirubrobacterales bacterium]
MKKSLLLLPCVLIAAALALSACGGGSSSSGGSGDETAIEGAIETAATSTDPSKCTEVQTQKFNEAETGTSGKASLKACEQEAEEDESPAESVTVSNVEVDGETATAQVEVGGGALNSQGIELELAKEEGNWKLNQFLQFTNFDAKALGEGLEEKLLEENGISASLAKCISEGVAGISQSDAEELAFESNLEPIEKLVESCK